jgi:Tfp pilus assembly protein PilX
MKNDEKELKMKTKILSNDKGVAAFIAMMVMMLMALIGIAAIDNTNDEITIAGNEMNEMASFYAAEAGLEFACTEIQNYYEDSNRAPSTMPAGSEIISDAVTAAYVTSDDGPAVSTKLIVGSLAGLNALVKTFTVSSIGTSLNHGSQMRLEQKFQSALVPLFQFAVFYENDLEISPGPDMTISGRVHTNGDLWLNPQSSLRMDDYVTCAGNIHHGPGGSYASERSGDVFIKDIYGNYQNMKNADGTFLESSDAHWYDSAAARWKGRVQDAAFGQSELNMPIASSDPHNLIERYNGGANPDSYELKANAKIIDGAYMAKVGGVWQNVTSLLPAGTITTQSFYDYREGKTVVSTDVDMGLLKTSAYYPTDGVIYSSDQRGGSYNALRLKNGSDIGTPLSVFSENPMYVQGDYNTINKQPACLAADAVTFLSNNWNDANAATSSSPFSNRIPTPTTCNSSIITGNTVMTNSVDNGGLENLLRYMENWNGVTYTISGSIVNLWHVEQALGAWVYGDPIYEAPNRDYSFDTDLTDPNKLPPETPTIQIFQRTAWVQKDVGYESLTDTLYSDSVYSGPTTP